ncbi:MAG: 3-carboxy-cis,cis-muconate cycloisomerase [Geminicoccaceae bacterium]
MRITVFCMAFSLFDHPHFSTLLRHHEIADLFDADAELSAMLRFEAALAEVEADLDVIPKDAGAAIAASIRAFKPPYDILVQGARRDGLIVPSLVASLRDAVPEAYRAHVHFGATSQDVIDTGLILRMKQALAILRRDLEAVLSSLNKLSSDRGETQIMGRTRMQRALPIRLKDRLSTWISPLARQLESLDVFEKNLLAVQFGGAVGTLDKLGDRGPAVRAALAERLGLVDPERPWHADRDRVADLAGWLSKVSGSIGKMGQDLVLMAQNEIGEASFESGGTSSAMPHKKNPVQAEILITLARYNAGQVGLIHQSLVHEGERSGAAWTLEWMVVPGMFAATGASLMIAKSCLDGLTVNSPG